MSRYGVSLVVILLVLCISCRECFFSRSKRPLNSESFLQFRKVRQGNQWVSLLSGQPSIDEDTATFLSWAAAEGISALKCEVHNFPMGLRGLRAVDDIDENEVFLSVPLSLCLCSERDYALKLNLNTIDKTSGTSRVDILNSVSSDVPVLAHHTDRFEWPVALAIQIITESRLERSILAPYIATLPKAIDKLAHDGQSLSKSLPLHWSDVSNTLSSLLKHNFHTSPFHFIPFLTTTLHFIPLLTIPLILHPLCRMPLNC